MTNEELEQHISKYKSYIDSSKNAIIVAHSQGNFYANQAWDQLWLNPSTRSYTNHLAIVGVASPANRVAGSGNYTTLSNDEVINKLRNAYTILPPVEGPNPPYVNPTDPDNHGFTEAYLYHSDITERISGHVDSAIAGLTTPDNNSDQIRVAVTPTSMYIEEPGGNILKNGTLQGIHGTITNGTYTIPCDPGASGSIVPGINKTAISAGTTYSMSLFNGIELLGTETCIAGQASYNSDAWTFGLVININKATHRIGLTLNPFVSGCY